VALLDIRMPVLDGLRAAREVIALSPGTRVLILTTFDADEYVYEALRGGASGFLLKDAPADQLITAVRSLAAGDALVARGLSNVEIARELVVEENTVKTHVSRILMKLGLRDRVQAVVLAYELGFVTPGGAGLTGCGQWVSATTRATRATATMVPVTTLSLPGLL
jgi:DNA-binding NarL/FixJ family response regulator